jgi:hypothetical protein
MAVYLELVLRDTREQSNGGSYWTKDLPAGLPSAGDAIELTEGGWTERATGRYWRYDGDVVVQLPKVWVDPEPDAVLPKNGWTTWHSSAEGGDLVPRLIASGWVSGVRH